MTMIPTTLRDIEVTAGMFQTITHFLSWRDLKRPILTERAKRWRVPRKYEDFMWRHYGRRCVHCRTTEHLTIGHIIPVQFGGSNEPSNIRPECLTCNLAQWTPECAAISKQLAEREAA
jgi:5-methylcytosine-specific restriction endonuclease McrA